MTKIYLVRHGATVLSREDRFAGSSNVALSEEGIQQAEMLGKRVAKLRIAAIYCSDMARTVHTARLIAAPHGLTPIERPALREMDHGHWEGRLHKEVEEKFAGEYTAWDADPFLSAPPGGETGMNVLARSWPELRRIVMDHSAQNVIVVSHKATNRLLLCGIMGIDPRTYRSRVAQDTACLNVIEFKDSANGRVLLMNDISHYSASA